MKIKYVFSIALPLLLCCGAAGAGSPLSLLTAGSKPQEDCWSHSLEVHAKEPVDHDRILDQEIAEYQVAVEQALAYRSETAMVGRVLKAKVAADQPLSGKELDLLNSGTVAHLELRQRLYHLAEMHECWLGLKEAEVPALGLTPLERMQGIMVSLSAALVLYDNYLLAISLFEEDDKLRRLINLSDQGYALSEAELAKITLSYNSIENRSRVRRAINYYEEHIGEFKQELVENPAMRYLNLLIQQSPSYEMTKSYSPLFVLGQKLDFLGAITSDTLARVQNEGINVFSMLFGNAVGLIESRRGKLYERKDAITMLSSNLQAGDILLEKTPFRLTDSFIPGHWGHAALWIGTENELRRLGIWEHELVRPHQAAIRQGNLVIEALRSGVELNSLQRFINVDDLAVLRDPDANKTKRAEIILLALRQIGKSYDFNFDVETTDRIVCSELIYLTYADIHWPTDKTLGRTTISPDNIAQKAIDNGPLKIVTLFHDGQLVANNRAVRMRRLLHP